MTGMLCNVATWFHTLLRQRNHRNLAARTLDSPGFLLFRLFSFVSPLESTSSSLFVSGSRSRRCLAISPTRFCIQFCGSHETCLRSLANSFMRGVFNFSNTSSFAIAESTCDFPHNRGNHVAKYYSSCTSIKSLKKPLPILNTGIYFARISSFSFLSLSVSFSLQLVIEADLQDDVYGLDSRLSISIAWAFLPWRVYEQTRRIRFFVNERGNLTCRLL